MAEKKKIGGYKLPADKRKELKDLLDESEGIGKDLKVLKSVGINTADTEKLVDTAKQSLNILLKHFT